MLIEGVWHENLVRFPVERRAPVSYEMMCDLAPDWRMISHLVDALEIDDYDHDIGDKADCAMAEALKGMAVPQEAAARRQFFAGLRARSLKPAVAACVEAKRIADGTYQAGRVANRAEQNKELNAFALGRRANHFVHASAWAALEAHRLCEIARGQCRALTLAEMNEPWAPYDAQEAGAWLVEASSRATARQAAGKG